jgi:hypothetical protein
MPPGALPGSPASGRLGLIGPSQPLQPCSALRDCVETAQCQDSGLGLAKEEHELAPSSHQ